MSRPSGPPVTLWRVNRIVLIPSPTSDGRIVLRAEVLTVGERLRRFVRKLRARR